MLVLLLLGSLLVDGDDGKIEVKTGDPEYLDRLAAAGFRPLFDGKSLSGWKANENEGSWKAFDDGTIRGSGERSHLFSPKEYTDFELYAEVKINKGGNSGIYFRTKFMEGWPKGYESQVNNSSESEPQRTGGIYNMVKVTDVLVGDDQWWSHHIICKDNRIIVRINGREVVNFVDENRTYTKGHIAFQQHDPQSVVDFRNVMIKDEAPATAP